MSIAALGACTSFAELDDIPSDPASGPPAGGTSGAGGVPSTPLPGLGSSGSASVPPAPPPGSQTGGAGSVGPATPDGPPDAGPQPPPATPEPGRDAGAPPPEEPPPEQPAPFEPPGCLGVALDFDGATFASILRPVENDFTLEAWVRTTESLPGVNAGMGRIVFDGDIVGMGDNDDFAVTIVSDTLGFAVGNPNTSVLGLIPVTTGEWMHVAVTRRATDGALQIIINGQLQGVGMSANRNPLDARPDLAFGGFSAMRKFIGSIDEIKIWTLVRSVEQIAASMRQRPDPAEAGLVGYYSFEGQGTAQSNDGSNSGNTATLTGNPVYVPSSVLCNPPAAPLR